MKKLLLLLFLTPNLVMAEKYLCISDAAGGARFNEGINQYEGKVFKPGRKYILKKTEFGTWSWNKFGEKQEKLNLFDCGYIEALELLRCSTSGGELWFNYGKLRFGLTEIYGSYEPDSKSDTFLEVGTCSKI
jgi:hypothetical protein